MLYCFASEHHVERKINRLSLFTFFVFVFVLFCMFVCFFFFFFFFLLLAKNTFVEGCVSN